MAKKIILMILGAGIFLLLVFFNLSNFIDTTERLLQIKDLSTLKNYFEIYNTNSTVIYDESIKEIEGAITEVIDKVQAASNKSISEIILNLLSNLLDFTFNFLIYFCNFGINILFITWLTFHETINGTNLTIRTTPLAALYIKINKLISKIKQAVVKALKRLLSLLQKHRRKIALFILIIFLANGYLYHFATEVLIFLITYILDMMNLETYLTIFTILKFLFLITYPKLKYIPTYLWIPLILILIFLRAISKANYKLKKNHERLKAFAKDDLTQSTFINGPPGTGKTLLNVSLTLASEENFIEELEKNLLDYELNYKYLNFAKVRANPQDFPEHKDYTRFYELLNNRKSLNISNYAIYSPLFEDFSKIFNFDYMRVNKPTDTYPLEEYITISISEFDKEYNSHDNKKEVGEDGAATFFSTISHNLKRHVKIFVDYQLKDQVPLRIRGNAEYFITIKKRDKKYPILLYLYYLSFKLIYKILRNLIKRYELKKKPISKHSNRTSIGIYKRNDITFIYAILRNLSHQLMRICEWFDRFYYFKLTTILSQEGEEKGIQKKLCINIRDLTYNNQKLYDSTFLSYAYEQKKNKAFKDLDTFTSLTPSIEELEKCSSRFYSQINQK